MAPALVTDERLNGRMPRSHLSPIPGGLLQHAAAGAYNAMMAEARLKKMAGAGAPVDASYRPIGRPGDAERHRHGGPFTQWAAWEIYQAGGNIAARVGTSNHGMGIAVDCNPAQIQIVHEIGQHFGWAKKWSDAPTENWHFKYKPGVWHGESPPPGGPVTEQEIALLQQLLRSVGHEVPVVGLWTPGTERAVRSYQERHGLHADGVAGTATMKKLQESRRARHAHA